MITQLWSIGLVIFATIIGGFGPIYLKRGSEQINKNWKSIYKNKELIIGVLIYGISSILFILALKGGELSVLYPLVGLTYVWLCIYSKFMLNETMTTKKWIGIIIIIFGITLISIGI